MNDIDFIKKRFRDLANRAYMSGCFTFTDFLSEEDQSILLEMERELSFVPVTLYGGTDASTRQVARFGSPEELGYEQAFPVTCIEISPLSEKFGEALSHRDYLGALMNLGIERSLLGDILVKEKHAYVFCLDHITDFIIENITRIRHTVVMLKPLETAPESLKATFKDLDLIVASLRADVIVAALLKISRSQSQVLFSEKKVFLNGRLLLSTSTILDVGDKVSVRGFGKCIFQGSKGTTKKGRVHILLQLYC